MYKRVTAGIAGLIAVGALFTWAPTTPQRQVTASPGPSSRATYDTLREELRSDPGATVATGEIGGQPWTLRLFDDASDSMDGEGQNLYIDADGPRYWLDRPDGDQPFDSIWYAAEGGAEVLIVGVATDEVARLELRSGVERWEAQLVAPTAGAAFANGFWVEATSRQAPFAGELVAYDADGSIIQTRAFTTTPDREATAD